MDVIERRCRAHKALGAEDFFRVQAAIWAPELDVSLGRDLTEAGVVGHMRPPDMDCTAVASSEECGYRWVMHVAAMTTSRADWGHIEPVLRVLQDQCRLSLMVGGAHLETRFGLTVDAIAAAGYPITAEIPFLASDDSRRGMGEGIGRAVLGCTEALDQLKPDILLLIADRFEMLAPAAAAMALRIPIAHIEGGEISEGAVDQQVRDALTKMSHLHLVPTQEAADRVIAMGEAPWRVHITGAPSLDHLRRDAIPSRAEVEAAVGLSLDPAPIVVAFHPTTLREDTVDEAEVFFAAMGACPRPMVFCFPNADAGYSRIIELAEAICETRNDAVLRVNLDHLHYWGLLGHASCLAGNSSSGIMEAASLELPVVNVGMRQQGRTRAANIIDAPAAHHDIGEALELACSPTFRAGLRGLRNPYGDGHAADAIASAIISIDLNAEFVIKQQVSITPTCN